MLSAVTLTRFVCFLALVFVQATGYKIKRLSAMSCPTVMCAKPCPRGEYLAINEYGCETCDCYDPCEGFECEAGDCHWSLGENARPVNFCSNCEGGQIWSDCTGGINCVATCDNPTPVCNRNCFVGCQCPLENPIFHQGRCITVDQCQGACEGGKQWTEFGVENVATCKDLYPFNSRMSSVSRCQCPQDRPIWDADRSLCVTKSQCMKYYFQD